MKIFLCLLISRIGIIKVVRLLKVFYKYNVNFFEMIVVFFIELEKD